jgi:ribosomal protein L32
MEKALAAIPANTRGETVHQRRSHDSLGMITANADA